MVFGNSTINTFGVDSMPSGEYLELEPPPPSPTFDCIWKLPPGHAGQWGSYRGLLRRDWRRCFGVVHEARIDTFALAFSMNDDSDAAVAFKWPSCTSLIYACDSMFLFDPTGLMLWPRNRLDMLATDTLYVPAAGRMGISRFYIMKYGVWLPSDNGGGVSYSCTVGVETPGADVPMTTSIDQNFPNPFNPSTKIAVNIPTRQVAMLKVYAILGRYIATLFEGTLDPGRHEFAWDAAGAPDGVYFYRLQTEGSQQTGKMILAR
jgi:hypothetical protein